MRSLQYCIKEGFYGIKNNIGTSIGSVITICLSLFLIGLFVFFNTMIANVTNAVENQVTITAYIADSASQDESVYQPVAEEIESIDGVESVSFTSKEQAMEDFKATMKTDDIVNQLDGSNPLPASFSIALSDPQKVEEIADEILSMESFLAIADSPDNPTNSIKYGQKTVERLFSMTDTIRIVAMLLVILLIVVAFIFMNNTIRLTIMNRHQEISIQRLVGASNGFIRAPFIAEGIIQGVIGAVIAVVALIVLNICAMPFFASAMSWLPVDMNIWTQILTYVGLFVIAIVIGIVSSLLAMQRYLKV